MLCEKCGKQIEDKVIFCIHCHVLTGGRPDMQTDEHEEKKFSDGLSLEQCAT